MLTHLVVSVLMLGIMVESSWCHSYSYVTLLSASMRNSLFCCIIIFMVLCIGVGGSTTKRWELKPLALDKFLLLGLRVAWIIVQQPPSFT